MKKIIIFGASGGTGMEVVKQALEAGYRLTAVVRDPSTFSYTGLHSSSLKTIKGDVLDLSSFADAMAGQDAVISALGSRGIKPTRLYSKGISNILSAMSRHNITRIVCISAGALDINPKMGLFVRLLTRFVLQPILKEPYADLRLMEKEIQQAGSGYTIVRPPMLKDKKITGKYRVAVNDHIVRPFSIARADLAHFIVNHISDTETYRSIVEISY